MVTITEVRTKKEQKAFLDFPTKLYKDCPYFVPPLYIDEKKIFDSDYVYYDNSEAVYYLALRENKVVGRISGILQRASNEKRNEKRVRFTRFDAINDKEVAKALFDAVENWALSKGMDTVCGPLGFSDLEREGLLIEGFEHLSTFEEQYNYDYYKELIEYCGYGKEVDWVESKIYLQPEYLPEIKKLSDFVMQRYNLHYGSAKTKKEYIEKYSEQFFELLDVSYGQLYGTVPFTEGMKKMLIDNFKLVIDFKHAKVILDENEKMVCMGICFPSLSKALQPSHGHLTPAAIYRVLRAVKHPEIIDLGLIGVAPEYLNKGINAPICLFLAELLSEKGVEYAETNLNLEDNYQIQNQWKRFRAEHHKRRRSFVKTLKNEKA